MFPHLMSVKLIMEDLHREKPAFKGLAKWILVAACGLLTALLITVGVYFGIDRDSAGTVPVEQNQEASATQQKVAE